MCTYTRGIFHIHGDGAKGYWKPTNMTVLGPDERMTTRYARQTYYVCDIGPMRGEELRQQRLSFNKSTLELKSTSMIIDNDTKQGELSGNTTTSVGQ